MALILATAACDPPMIPGRDATDVYAFTLPTQPPLVFRWPSGSDIRVWIESGPSPEREGLLETAFAAGADAWNQHAVFGEYRLVRASSLGLADVVLSWSDVTPPVVTDACRPVVTQAVTTFCVEDLGGAAPRLQPYPLRTGGTSRVRMLVTVLGSEAARPEFVNRLVVHELGHVLGIGRHSPERDDLMWRTDPLVDRPSPRDAATVQVLYHVRPDIRP